MSSKIGFVGMGVMGLAMARNLLEKGFEVTVYSRTKRKAESLLAEGARWAATPAELAAGSDTVCLAVDDGRAVRDVLFGSGGVLERLPRNGTIIDFSTISPSEAREIGAEVAELGANFLDAPVTGGDTGARNATLTIMVGGTDAAFRDARPIFEAVGKKVLHFGPNGAGQLVKSVNQLAVGISILAMSEAFAFSRAASLPVEEVLDVIGSGAAGSWALVNYGPRVLKGDFAPGFYVRHMLKDLRIVREEAAILKLELPGLALVERLYGELVERGMGELGNHALTKCYEPQ